MTTKAVALASIALLFGCNNPSDSKNEEQSLRLLFKHATGAIALPAGVTELHAPLEFAPRAHDIVVRGASSGSTLLLLPDFPGKGAIVGARVSQISLENFSIAGTIGRGAVTRIYLPGSQTPFVNYYDRNGVVFSDSDHIQMRNVALSRIPGFAVLISHCNSVALDALIVEDSGTLNAAGHSNTTGGILLEQGTRDFSVRHCVVKNICGNGIWTHSNYGSELNRKGVISENEIRGTPRDAIQIGHATGVQVRNNLGGMIGFPPSQADLPGGATPVALDTAGDVSLSTYSGNRFQDVNGQCIDLDGFHDGQVTDNSCVNSKPPDTYPLSHDGIVFGNSNLNMRSKNVMVTGNLIQGFGYGGVYLIGEGHQIVGNRFVDVNRNHCTGDMRGPRCNYAPEEPAMLRSGIYLASHAARPGNTQGNRIQNNYINGFGMDRWCVTAGPGVSLSRNTIGENTCVGEGQGTPAP